MATVTRLLETESVVLGEFVCPPDDPAWRETNYIGDRPHVVFPLTEVVIEQVDKGSVLSTANHTIFYDAGQHYRRRLHSERGDHCIFINLRPGTLETLRQDVELDVVDERERVRVIDAPLDNSTYLACHLLVRRLRTAEDHSAAAEAEALRLVAATLARAAPVHRRRRRRTARAHRELAEAAKAELARSFAEPCSLEVLARRLHTSPFHLARVFRAETGFTVDGYRRALRLRSGLERLGSHGSGLTELALELGFSSHSHFTETFRREFGVPPSACR